MNSNADMQAGMREARDLNQPTVKSSWLPPGVGLGTLAGCMTGAAFGSAGGSVGAIIGSFIGTLVGWHAGKGIADVTDPALEEAFWAENARLKLHSGK